MKCLKFILGIFLAFFSLSCSNTKSATYTLEEINTSYVIEIPIDNPREAIEFAKGLMPYNDALNVFSNLSRDHDMIRGWTVCSRYKSPKGDIKFYKARYKNGLDSKKIFEKNVMKAKQQGSYWQVTYKTNGIIPSYSWIIKFLSDGTLIQNRHRWNK